MQYSLNKIGTVAACDTLLATAQKRKQAVARKRRNLGEAIDQFNNRLDKLTRELATVQLMLGAFTTLYSALPEGKDKINLNVEIKRLELRQARLQMKALTCNVRALLSKQMRYNMLDNQVSAIEAYITALQNKRTVLNVSSLGVARVSVADFSRPAVARQKSRAGKSTYKMQAHVPRVHTIMPNGKNKSLTKFLRLSNRNRRLTNPAKHI
jgi:hypothetical protein